MEAAHSTSDFVPSSDITVCGEIRICWENRTSERVIFWFALLSLLKLKLQNLIGKPLVT
jgi:hypothetical protein